MNNVFDRIFEEREIKKLSIDNPDLIPLNEDFFVKIALDENPGTKVLNVTIGDPTKVVVVLKKDLHRSDES